jgi:hypothetical protein
MPFLHGFFTATLAISATSVKRFFIGNDRTTKGQLSDSPIHFRRGGNKFFIKLIRTLTTVGTTARSYHLLYLMTPSFERYDKTFMGRVDCRLSISQQDVDARRRHVEIALWKLRALLAGTAAKSSRSVGIAAIASRRINEPRHRFI